MSSDTKEVADFSFLSSIQSPPVKEEKGREDAWPDRSPQMPVKEEMRQISVRGRVSVISRFKRLCAQERYSHGDMLEILLDAYEGRGR